MLADYPAALESRTKHNWFLKNFDTWHYAPHDRYIVIDSDIVFFRRPEKLMKWIADGDDTVWLMEDTNEKYALPREEIEAIMGLPLWRKVNSGPRSHAQGVVRSRPRREIPFPVRAEGQAFPISGADLFCGDRFGVGRGGGTLPPEYEISWGNFRRKDGVCRHYVGPFKDDLLWIEGATTFYLQSRGQR